MAKQGIFYIRSNKPKGTLYCGSTGNLAQRDEHHELGQGSKFVARYGLDKIMYYEVYLTQAEARQREYQVKEWRRSWKIDLIQSLNPTWQDLTSQILT